MKNKLAIIPDKHYSTGDVELFLGLSRETIRILIHEGKLKATKPRGHFRYLGRDILEFLEKIKCRKK